MSGAVVVCIILFHSLSVFLCVCGCCVVLGLCGGGGVVDDARLCVLLCL